MAEPMVIGPRTDVDVAFDLLRFVIERLPMQERPHAEKDVLALYARCAKAIYKRLD